MTIARAKDGRSASSEPTVPSCSHLSSGLGQTIVTVNGLFDSLNQLSLLESVLRVRHLVLAEVHAAPETLISPPSTHAGQPQQLAALDHISQVVSPILVGGYMLPLSKHYLCQASPRGASIWPLSSHGEVPWHCIKLRCNEKIRMINHAK